MYHRFYNNEVIDLTCSFVLVNHFALSNEVIDLVNDAPSDNSIIFDDAPSDNSIIFEDENAKKKTTVVKKSNKNCKKNLCNSKEVQTTMSRKIGNCPICFDDFRNKPLASTICGHVYCLKCLQQSLQVEKRCPTCRKMLKGNLAYHPIYLG